MKEKIVQKASEMFLNLGFKSVTMDDIANELGISKKTIYTHFNNKETIIAVVTDAIFEKVSHDIDCICNLEKNPIEETYEIKKRVMEHMRNEKTSPSHQLQKYYPAIYKNLKMRQFNFMQECVVRNLHRGIEQGLFRDNIDVQFVSRIYFTGVTGIKEESLFPGSMFEGQALYDMFLEYHLRGIVTPNGRKILNQLIQSNLD
ncbi:MAG TPA: TetR/AcrR family transcriptional regulator [Flavobacteriaceae bacterium]|jgi:AcrR family transcriptional regulator|nr:TetR family transcriptional regulator [Flavobacteriaceae bacterium]MAY52750.1 TetR family transcriptional regulator [Flavobacteriaceae bacterium]HIB47117.1 TetR/AcrR family transcriptional regulator [Flavobacteriaceae bacterium]HIN99273.1 TetR/AcrR family transcriptional regulator [Flavobacteriaceae bacterium]|tara:strand:+ start:479 stop:1084 length:606 start_codon:yes stop_codon:yes gene_type:complete